MEQSKFSKRIIVYSHDTYGLGNIRRMLLITQALVDADPDASVLILSGSPMLHAFRISPRIDYIKLPCLTRTMSGDYEAKSLDMERNQILRMRSNLIYNAVIDFKPDLILVDKKPFGVADELASAITRIKQQKHRTKMVLLLRDILDSSETTVRIWQKNAYHQAIESFYDKVLVVGSPEIFDMCKHYRFPLKSQQKVQFCGYLGRQLGKTSRMHTRQNLGFNQERVILVTPGGGEDGFQLLNCFLKGWQAVGGIDNAKVWVICGPEMQEQNLQQIYRRIGDDPNIVMQKFTDDMMACMDAADLVVSMGGYNTVCELLTLQKRAIVVPRVKPVLEQWIRADRMARLGLISAVHPDQMTPELLMTTVKNELAFDPSSSSQFNIDMNGLSQVCQAINELIEINPKEVKTPISKKKSASQIVRQQSKTTYLQGAPFHERFVN